MIFNLENNAGTRGFYVVATVLLAAITFANLPDLLLDTDDREYFAEAERARRDLSHLFSPDRHPSTIGRPVIDLVFLINHALWADAPPPYHLQVIALHVLASLLLTLVFHRLGADLELSLLGGWLFLMNVAHFRAIHWIASVGYPLSLILGLGALGFFLTYLNTRSRPRLLAAALTLWAAVWTHPSAVSIALFCVYIARRKTGSTRRAAALAWPLIAAALCSGALAYLIYPRAAQVEAVSVPPEPLRILETLLWYTSRLVTAAHWLFVDLRDTPYPWEPGVGLLACLGLFLLYRRRNFPIADFGVWTILSILPFFNAAPGFRWTPAGPSRHLYFASAGASLILAWLLRTTARRIAVRWGEKWGRAALGILLPGLLLSSYVASKRTEAVSYYASGRGYIARSDTETGARQLQKALQRAPGLIPPEACSYLAAAFLSRGEPLQPLLEPIRANPPDASYIPCIDVLLGASAFLENTPESWNRGETRIRKALETAPDNTQLRADAALAFFNLGSFYFQSRQLNQAEELYLRALRIRPGYPQALFSLGNVLGARQKFEEAVPILEKAVSLDSTRAEGWNLLGLAYRRIGQPQPAEQAYRKALDLSPEDPDILNNLAVVRIEQGHLETACRTLQTLVERRPDRADFRMNLAVVLYLRGEPGAALAQCRRILEQHPDHPAARAFIEKIRTERAPSAP